MEHVGRRYFGLAERACTEGWWVRREHGWVEVVCGEEGACDFDRVVVCLLPLLPVLALDLYIGKPTAVKLKLESW